MVLKQLSIDINLITDAKINLKWIRELNVKCKTIKLWRKALGSRGRQRILTLDGKRIVH